MKKFVVFFALVMLSCLVVNAQETTHQVTRNGIKQGAIFMPFTLEGETPIFETWTKKTGNLSIINDGVSRVKLYGSGSFEFVYYGYYGPGKSVTINVNGYFSTDSGGGNSGGGNNGGGITPLPWQEIPDEPEPALP